MLLAGPGQDPVECERFWKSGLGFTGAETPRTLPFSGLESWSRYDAALRLHTEYTSWQTKKGPIAVVYSGMNGTYQWNRPHFIDFVRSVTSNRK